MLDDNLSAVFGLNVHDVGNLAPKVTESVLAALKDRKNPSRPLPRVLFTCVIAWHEVQVIPACAVGWFTSSKSGSSKAPVSRTRRSARA